MWFEPSASGTYYVAVSDPTTIGPYSVSAVPVSADYKDDPTTTGTVTVGGPAATGSLTTAGQIDWLAVSLTANQAYDFTITGLDDFAEITVGSNRQIWRVFRALLRTLPGVASRRDTDGLVRTKHVGDVHMSLSPIRRRSGRTV